jgi:hypothetical protein
MLFAFVAAQLLLPQVPREVSTELIASAGLARSVNLFESTADRRYLVQTISWGRTVTRDLTFGPMRGRFAWAVEVTPVFLQTAPARNYGMGVAPVVWRWNFPRRPKWSAFGELSFGGLWTTDPIPEGTKRANFTAHWGGGIRLGTRANRAIVISYRFQHISNGNQLASNPGVNSHVLMLGASFRR